MYKVTKVEVSGLAGSQDEQIFELNDDLNIFWGLNGSGKTSLLKLISSAMSGNEAEISDLAFRKATVTFQHLESKNTFSKSVSKRIKAPSRTRTDAQDEELFEFEVNESPSLFDSEVAPAWRIDTNFEKSHLLPPNRRMVHSFLPTSRITKGSAVAPSLRYRNDSGGLDDDTLSRLFAEDVNRRWNHYTTRSLGIVKSIQQRGLAEVLSLLLERRPNADEWRAEIDNPEFAYDIVRKFLRDQDVPFNLSLRDFEEQFNSRLEIQEIVRKIERVNDEVERTQKPQNDFIEIVNSFLSGRKRIEVETANRFRRGISVYMHESPVPLYGVSSGERQLIHILVIVMTGGNRTVIIDEPELSLHVDWQEELVSAMRRINPSAQLILATHSPEIMANSSDDKIFRIA